MFNLNSLKKLTLVSLMSAVLFACDDDDSEPEPVTVVDVAIEDGNFTTLVAALQATGLDEVLDDENGSFTVFAPTDAAFAALGQDTINALLADPDTLSNILLYHVVSGAEIDSAGAVAAAGTKVEVANGDSIAVSYVDPALYINTAMVVTADVDADNGIIHALDAVIMPPAEMGTPTLNIVETAAANSDFTTLVTALQAAGLDSVLADEDTTFTVFAPTNDAFDALPAGVLDSLLADTDALSAVLLKHVISGSAVDSITAMTLNGNAATTAGGDMVDIQIADGQLLIGGAAVTVADLYTTNGVIHVIDTVITD